MAFHRVLIANRGEIAVRIIRSAHDLGYQTVAVASEADADAPHVHLADQAVIIGPAEVARSYLDIEAILDAARLSEANAVHPGYGFLAENAGFAEACAGQGLVFIGPPVEAIRLMGNKRLAKLSMAEAGVPSIPGYGGAAQDDATLARAAGEIGFPLMVKAATGGGGRGMRLVEAAAALDDALKGARSEAQHAFGSGELILERAIVGGRHVEIQIFGDRHGNFVHLGERDCSIQRRHQKVIEEAPSPAVDGKLRARMGAAAIAAARAIDYVGAGTVEFLLDSDGGFHFLEMNTRLQVEHPVTEMITGQDLVAWQLDIAAGGALPLQQSEVNLNGHAIEARLYAEDPANGFLPQTGRIVAWEAAAGPGVRVDHGIAAGQEVTAFYDPLMAKVIAHGRTREEARRRLIRALEGTNILGLQTNKRFLIEALEDEAFCAGEATTGFIDAQFPPKRLARPDLGSPLLALAAALLYEYSASGEAWRSATPASATLYLGDGNDVYAAELSPRDNRTYQIEIEGAPATEIIRLVETAAGHVRYEHDGVNNRAIHAFDGATLHLEVAGRSLSIAETPPYLGRQADVAGDGQLLAPMAGRIVLVRAVTGSQVTKDDILVVLEAMKMEHEIRAGVDGTVVEVKVSEGDQVMPRQLLAAVEPEATPAAE